MANLNGVYVDSATSYKGLLNLGNSVGSNLSPTLQFITDGDNNSSALRVATNAVQVYNTTVDKAFSIVGTGGFPATFNTVNIEAGEKTFTFPNISGTFAFIDVAQTYTAQGAASTAAIALTGTPFVGTGTTSVPLFYLNGGSAPTTWNSAANGGTYIGINATSTFAGNFIDFRQNGSASIFSVNVFGGLQTGAGATNTFRGNIQLQGNFTTINKAQSSYLTFITRNTSGSETLMDFTNVGTLTASGAISIGNTVAAAVGIASTHKVTMVIGGTTYYLLASNV